MYFSAMYTQILLGVPLLGVYHQNTVMGEMAIFNLYTRKISHIQ